LQDESKAVEKKLRAEVRDLTAKVFQAKERENLAKGLCTFFSVFGNVVC